MAEYDFHDQLIQIEMLFQSHIISYGFKEYSLETFADQKYFSSWKGNEDCKNTDEMRKGQNIDGILQSTEPSENEALTYLQYVLNIAELCRRSFSAGPIEGYDFDVKKYTELLTRIRTILKQLHYQSKYVAEKEYIYLVPHDPALDALDTESEDPVVTEITEYRSAALNGKPDRKREILKSLSNEIEGYEDNKSSQGVRLMQKIHFLEDGFNIFQKEDHPDYDVINKMTPDELETWYDRLFQLMVLRVLEHDSIDRIKEVDQLADDCGVPQYELTDEEMAKLLSVTGVPDEEETEKSDDSDSKEKPENDSEETISSELPVKQKNPHTIRNVVIAIVIADILFVLFMLLYLSI